MSRGINELLERAEKLECQIKKLYPKQSGRVRIAEAKQFVDYEIGKDADQMKWIVKYCQELERRI
jgi:hypothetical protein